MLMPMLRRLLGPRRQGNGRSQGPVTTAAPNRCTAVRRILAGAVASLVVAASPAVAAGDRAAFVTVTAAHGRSAVLDLPRTSSLALEPDGVPVNRAGILGGVAVEYGSGRVVYAAALYAVPGGYSPGVVALTYRPAVPRGRYTVSVFGTVSRVRLRAAGLTSSISISAHGRGVVSARSLAAGAGAQAWSEAVPVPDSPGFLVLLFGDHGAGGVSTGSGCLWDTDRRECAAADSTGGYSSVSGPVPPVTTAHARGTWLVFGDRVPAPAGPRTYAGVAGPGAAWHEALWISSPSWRSAQRQ